MADVTLVLGGARSGKSARALALAGSPPHVFIATAEALDEEMAARIKAHQNEREDTWELVEAPLALADAITERASPETAILVDCLTLWLSNLMHHHRSVEAETGRLLEVLEAAPGLIVLVSNEVGMGLAPDNALGRRFRDEQGRLNRRVAEVADRVEFVAAGLPLVLKG